MLRLKTHMVLPLLLLAWTVHANEASHGSQHASPYAGQQSRVIKSLSQDDIQSYLTGKGMGMAKAAELNGYPGPMHVLEMADKLSLTAEQKQQSETVYRQMKSRAVELGKSLVEEERSLDRAFADKSVTAEGMEKILARIGTLQAQLRQVHLDAHLKQAGILTPVQVAHYNSLRGYDKSGHSAKEYGYGGHQGHGH